jgi:hypothetical protein
MRIVTRAIASSAIPKIETPDFFCGCVEGVEVGGGVFDLFIFNYYFISIIVGHDCFKLGGADMQCAFILGVPDYLKDVVRGFSYFTGIEYLLLFVQQLAEFVRALPEVVELCGGRKRTTNSIARKCRVEEVFDIVVRTKMGR